MAFTRLHHTLPFAALTLLCALPATSAFAAPKTRLTMTAAKKIALAKESGTIKSGELEHEKGRWIYSFDIDKGVQVREVNVDANTGTIVEDSLDTPADEAKEARQDAAKAPHAR